MDIQQIVPVVRIVRVTGFAGLAALGHGNRRAAPGDFVVDGFVAFGALEIVPAHVDIAVAVGPVQVFRHVGVFDRIAATAAEMAVPAGLAAGIADIFGHHDQIHILGRHARSRGCLFVGARGVVTHEAVYTGLVREIETLVLPSVADVT